MHCSRTFKLRARLDGVSSTLNPDQDYHRGGVPRLSLINSIGDSRDRLYTSIKTKTRNSALLALHNNTQASLTRIEFESRKTENHIAQKIQGGPKKGLNPLP